MKANKETVGQRLSRLALEHLTLLTHSQELEGLLLRIVASSRIHDKESKCYDACERCAAMDDARRFLSGGS